jgi:integrase
VVTRTNDPFARASRGRNGDPVSVRTSRLRANSQGYWEIWFSEKDATGDTKTRRISCRTKDHVDAQDILNAFRDSERASVARQRGTSALTVEDLCERWLEYVAPQGKAKTGTYVLRTIRQRLGRYTVDQLTDARLHDYAGRGVSNGSIRRELGGLKTVLLWAAKKKLITRTDVPEIELPPGGSPRMKFLDPTQESWFWDQAMTQWSQAQGQNGNVVKSAERVMLFVALGLETAARRGAIYDLTWDRVDLVRGSIDYRVPGRRVTKKRRVLVPISDRLLPVLEAARRRAPCDASGEAAGRVLGEAACLRRAFRVFAQGLGMAWVTPHVLRHTWASLAAMNGVSLWDIAQVMGDTIATVERNYLHLTPGHLRAAINHKAIGPNAAIVAGAVP